MKAPASHHAESYWPQQSPVDLGNSLYVPGLPGLSFQYPQELQGKFKDDHEFHITGKKSATLTYDGLVCPLIKMHFHDPSEHTLGLETADLEAHLIHQIPGRAKDHASSLLVVGVFYDAKKSKPFARRVADASVLHEEKRRAVVRSERVPSSRSC